MTKINFKVKFSLFSLIFSVSVVAQKIDTTKTIQQDLLSEKFKTELSTNKGYNAIPYQVDADGFGFVILFDNKIIIDQPFVPGVEGFVRFKNQGQAQKIGNQMTKKLVSKIFPPHITSRELDSLNIDIKPTKK